MTKTAGFLCALSVSLWAQAANAECSYPNRVDVPNGMGLTATKEEMLSMRDNVVDYIAQLQEYQQCIEDEEKTARMAMDNLAPEDEQQRDDILNKKYNAAVDEMTRVEVLFNAELQAFNSRGKN